MLAEAFTLLIFYLKQQNRWNKLTHVINYCYLIVQKNLILIQNYESKLLKKHVTCSHKKDNYKWIS